MAVVACAACGDNRGRASEAMPSDAPPSDSMIACAAVFSGNFAETASTTAPCASLDASGRFAMTIPAPDLVAGLVVTIPVRGGSASSQTTSGWSVMATRMRDHDACVLDAGDTVVPHGSFELVLTSTAPPHGTLSLDQPVRAAALADCGAPLTEHVEVTF